MQFNKHSDLKGLHAFLGASKYSWTNYSDEHLEERYRLSMAAQEGSRLHDFAHQAISLGITLPRTNKTLNRYVNDAIGFRMTSEQTLYYSINCFGTADTIRYKRGQLRIHDLKTGVTKASFRQLEIYAALFCLEYRVPPGELEFILRIYQNDDVEEYIPGYDDIAHIMDTIIRFDKRIEELKLEA
ncbi:MAG TPA: hypothetical protein PKD68_03615 [Candidatus Saccharibacteria bacterium]|nr:hypothetical protein [Candidatus Saccharibacteria bacterium]